MNNPPRFSSQRIVLLAILSTLAYVGRLLLQPIPNVQPVTAILLLITLLMGTWEGVIVAVVSMVLSNIFMGMGPWTLAQIATYAIIIIFTGVFVKKFYQPHSLINRCFFSFYAFLMGMAYGLIVSIFSVWMLRINHFWVYYLRGIPFDLLHGAGNAAFYFVLEPILSPLIQKYLNKK